MDVLETLLQIRDKAVQACPLNGANKTYDGRGQCPNCGSTYSGPCWVTVRADQAFVSAVQLNLNRIGEMKQ